MTEAEGLRKFWKEFDKMEKEETQKQIFQKRDLKR